MLEVVEGEIYHLYAETEKEAIEASRSFFESGNHENDLVAINGLSDEPFYISNNDVKCGMVGDDCYVYFTWRVFRDARNNHHLKNGGVVPALNELGEPVCLLKAKESITYFHDYKIINCKPDTRIFSFYDIVVLVNVTEYSFLLLKDALAGYSGKIFCIGTAWLEFQHFFSDRNNIEYANKLEDIIYSTVGKKTMYLKEFGSYSVGWRERCEQGIFSYDEIMTLVYFFSIRKSYGADYPEKKYYLVGSVFSTEGLMSICDKVSLSYAYAEANGFIPVIRVLHSKMYSDFQGDDIWGKFFEQPYGKETLGWENAQNVWEPPFSCISFPMMQWLMNKIIECKSVQLVNTFLINERVKEEIGRIRNDVLPNPQRTIGVLIRGTDYTATQLPGHSVMASPEQVFEKIKEFERSGNYDQIFLSTEDEDILQTMKELCGDRLHFIDQKRFRTQPGELLSHQTKERENEGWLRGKEYLATLQLLSECISFIASGWCNGTACVMNTSGKHFKETYIFELGVH